MRFSITPFSFFRLILLCLLMIISSCSLKKKENKESWIGKELIIPEVTSFDKKIITRFEGDCPACIESIKSWEKFCCVAKEKNSKIKFVFYVEIIKEETFKELEQKLNFADYVIFDQRGSFFKENLLKFPYGLEDQTFLLNEKNEILLFGNPIIKKELISKYIKKI